MPEEACPTCKQGKLVNVEKEGNVEVKEFSCGHRCFTVMLEEPIKVRDELRLKLKGPKGKRKRIREITTRKARGLERRTVKERDVTKEDTSVIMIDWKEGEISHIHCKRCGNEWRDDECRDIITKFEIEPKATGVFVIGCKKCGRTAKSG